MGPGLTQTKFVDRPGLAVLMLIMASQIIHYSASPLLRWQSDGNHVSTRHYLVADMHLLGLGAVMVRKKP